MSYRLPAACTIEPLAPRVTHQGLDSARQRFDRLAGLLLQKLPLVVVDRDVVGKPEELVQLFGREHRQALPRIEHERYAVLGAFACVLLHALFTVGSDDRELGAELCAYMILVRIVHCPRMKGGDLVVVEIGGNESLRRELARDCA